jgi:DNA-3-methyladenine glycosylase II
MDQLDKNTFKTLCTKVAGLDAHLQQIIKVHGHPPFWVRPNTFATLVLIILEQQVSLASAYAAYVKLKAKVGAVTPRKILALTDEELRSCYFSRQKTAYVRGLATAVLQEQINLKELSLLPDEVVRAQLKQLKGIGDWTVDIYLLHALRRTDIFPLGDLALVNALKSVKCLPATTPKEDLLQMAAPWQPYRSIATMLLWHYYIQQKSIKVIF